MNPQGLRLDVFETLSLADSEFPPFRNVQGLRARVAESRGFEPLELSFYRLASGYLRPLGQLSIWWVVPDSNRVNP